MTDFGHTADFRTRFRDGRTLLGSFIKTPTSHTVEILGGMGFDFVVIDEEHAPFDRVTIDVALLAARASGTAGIVRVAEPTSSKLLAVLDDGAVGVLIPHVASVAKAKAVVSACRYRGGSRGFSSSPRAGGYGAIAAWPHVDAQDATVTVIAMIEDPEAIEDIDAIAAVEGLDGIFIGRGDLSIALGAESPNAPEIRAATEKAVKAARAVGKPACLMVNSIAETAQFIEMDATTFIVSSDQGFMRQAAAKVMDDFKALKT